MSGMWVHEAAVTTVGWCGLNGVHIRSHGFSSGNSFKVTSKSCLFVGAVRSIKIENPHLQRVNGGFKFLYASAPNEKTNF
jgi:hypothetical protein